MGTNFYMRKKEPRVEVVYDEIHVAKTSWGWRPVFEQHRDMGINSVADYKELYDSGEWIIVDEYGEELPDWGAFEERVVKWDEKQRAGGHEPIDHVQNDLMNGYLDDPHYHDPEGHDFFEWEFC